MKRTRNISIGILYAGAVIFLFRLYELPFVWRRLCSAVDFIQPGISSQYAGCPVDPSTKKYQKFYIEGFTILVHPELHNRRAETDELLRELAQSLEKIAGIMPPDKLSVLQKVVIWIEPAQRKSVSANDSRVKATQPNNQASEWAEMPIVGTYYHYSKDTLTRMGYNPDKAQNIGILDVSTFIQYSQEQQLRLVLHELAHAYHYRVLGTTYAGIGNAYSQAVKRKLYESVEHTGGDKGKAYALYSQFEYFAELSVVYFAKNEYYPFTRTDLANYDPVGYRLMEEIWGEFKE
jgi:hypothetical protein